MPAAQGSWQGSWHTTTCTGTGAFVPQTCSGLLQGGHTLSRNWTALRARSTLMDSSLLPGLGVLPPYDPWTLNALNATITGTSLAGTFSCTIPVANAMVALTGTLDASRYSPDPNAPPYS